MNPFDGPMDPGMGTPPGGMPPNSFSGPPMSMHNGPMGGPNGPMGGPNGMMGGPNGPMGGPNGPMGGPNGPMGGPNGPMGGPNGPMGGPNGPMGGPNGPMGGPIMGHGHVGQGPPTSFNGPGPHPGMGPGPLYSQGMMGPRPGMPMQAGPGPGPQTGGKMYPPDQPMVFNPSNPNAPPIYPCGVCHKEVHDNDHAILCESGCNFWYHRACTGLTEPAYLMLTKELYAEWVCDKCLNTKNIPVVKIKP